MFRKVQYKLTLWFVFFSLVPIGIFHFTPGIPFYHSIIVGTGSIIAALLVARKFAQPIKVASDSLSRLAQGDLHPPLSHKIVHDERGALILGCQQIAKYMKDIVHVLHGLSQGEFRLDFQTRSTSDELGQACTELVSYRKQLVHTIRRIREGNISTAVASLPEGDKLGQNLQGILELFHTVASQLKETADQIVMMSQDVVERSNTEIQNIEKLLNSAEGTSSSMAEMQASVEEVGMNIEALAASFEATSSSIGQMGSSISQVTRNSEKLSEFVEKTSAIIAQAVSAMEKESSGHRWLQMTTAPWPGGIGSRPPIRARHRMRTIRYSST